LYDSKRPGEFVVYWFAEYQIINLWIFVLTIDAVVNHHRMNSVSHGKITLFRYAHQTFRMVN